MNTLSDVESLLNQMSVLNSKRGLLLTQGNIKDEVRRIANENGIIIIDNINSESDLISQLDKIDLSKDDYPDMVEKIHHS